MAGTDVLIGQTIAHYRILEKIGAGETGVVCPEHDKQSDRDVAFKILPTGFLAIGQTESPEH